MNTFRLFSLISIALLFSCVGTTLKCMDSKTLDKAIKQALTLSKGRVSEKAAVVVSLKRDKESDEAVDSALAEALDRELDRELDKHSKKIDKHSKKITKRQKGNGQTDVREQKENKQKNKQRIPRKNKGCLFCLWYSVPQKSDSVI